jgi:3'-phosphoadenosine 5'-phosphosulfate sulfotransferase (PAPS reductase)/FAD synthetase
MSEPTTRDLALSPARILAAKLAKQNQLKAWGFARFGCECCTAHDAAADEPAELAHLLVHTRFDHATPQGILGIREPRLVWDGAHIERQL